MKANSLLEKVAKVGKTEFVHLEEVLRRALKVDEKALSKILGNKEARQELLAGIKTQGSKDDVGTLEVSMADVPEVVKRYGALREAPPVGAKKSKWVGREIMDTGAGGFGAGGLDAGGLGGFARRH